MMDIIKAGTLKEALYYLGKGSKPLAGATNIFVDTAKKGIIYDSLIDISGLEELKGIEETENEYIIGPLTTFDTAESFFTEREDVLYQAAYDMGGPQIRNRATIGGNICDASPACDAGPALLVLDANLVLVSERGERTVRAADFFRGVRQTGIESDELLREIRIRKEPGFSCFRKTGLRNAMSISIASIALKKARSGIRIAMGSVAPAPVRLTNCEKYIDKTGTIGKERLQRELNKDISPISDIRASSGYRALCAFNILVSSLKEAGYEFV